MSIFRRMFNRKDNSITVNQQYQNRQEIIATPLTTWSHSPKSIRKSSNTSQENNNGIPVLQLTPLWEHIIRTRTLPENLDPNDMFHEFLERLKDPEWQVRQHALRVLIDVLLVLGQKSDTYFHRILSQLVENLGHPAPTVRKGALDCLRVYLSETAMAESIVLEILDIGLNQRITNEPFGGRLTCSVMLSLPILIQTTLESTKRSFILQSTIEMLIAKMTQITHQEVTLKVLSKIKDMIGPQEFSEYMSEKSLREYELLCNVYGINEELTCESNSLKSWRLIPSFDSESDTYQSIEPYWKTPTTTTTAQCKDKKAKVILETEIKINDDTLMMRILEANDDNQSIDGKIPENCKMPLQINNNIKNNRNENINSNNNNSSDKNNKDKNDGILTDSEIDEINYSIINHSEQNNNLEMLDNTPRTPKRVTFGGEIIKMRTPDSDTTIVASDFDDNSSKSTLKPNSNLILNNIGNSENFSKLLTVEIANDNTKPIVIESRMTSSRPNSASPQSIRRSNENLFNPSPKKQQTSEENENRSQRPQTSSPKSPFKRIAISPVDEIISPITAHKEIEVLHNLQRDISPKRPLSKTITSEERTTVNMVHTENGERTNNCTPNLNKPENIARSWEELGIVQPEVIQNLKSGDWRYRSSAICQIENALRSSDTLALVQPSLDSLLRTLLSSEKNTDVAEDKRRVITNLISRLPLDNLENRTTQIITGLCRQGGPGSNRISKTLMQRLPPAAIVLKLLSDEFLHARSSRFRENALQMVMYALTTFPSTCFDTSMCIKLATSTALDRKKRVRQASLDVLAILGQVTSPKTCLDIVQNTLQSRTDISSSDAIELCAAIKARLTRKQLPYITQDGFVHYTLKVPSPQQANDSTEHIGADIQWIVSGIGSVSPTSIKRRLRYSDTTGNNQASRICISDTNTNRKNGRQIRPPHEILAYSVGAKHLDHNEETTKLGPTKGSGEIIGINGRRIATKSCSDSLPDTRNANNTHDNRFKQHSVTSRFPVMEGLNGQRMPADKHQTYHNPYDVTTTNGNRFNVTYPRPSYSVYRKKHYYNQDNLSESNSDSNYGYGLNSTTSNIDNSMENKKRFMNVEKFMQSNKQQIYSTDSIHHQNFNDFYQDEMKYNDEKELSRTPCCENRFIPSAAHERVDEINNQTFTESSNNESSEISSSEDRIISSSHSTPTRMIDLHISSTKNQDNDFGNENRSSAASRPQSSFRAHELMNKQDSFEENLQNTPVKSLKDYSRPQSAFSGKSFMIQEDTIDSLNNINEPDDFNKIDEIDAEQQEPGEDIDNSKPVNLFNRSASDLRKGGSNENINSNNDYDFESNAQGHDDYDEQPMVELISRSSSSGDIPAVEVKIVSRPQSNLSRPQSNLSRPQSVISRSQSLMSKSCESIYQSPRKDLEVESTASTATSSEYPASQATSLDCPLSKTISNFNTIKSKLPIPPLLARKSKTTLFGNRNRRVSPIKQSLKLAKNELYPQTLTKFDKPKEGLNQCFQQLESQNWEMVMNGLVSIVRLMRHHPELVDTHMHMVTMLLSKTVKNLRSQVSRAACQASTEFFTVPAKFLEQECDDLVGSLLHRTADTNRFLRADANRALMSMCDNLSPPKVLHLLTARGMSHQNAVVRTTTAKLMNRLVDRLGCDKVYAMSRENREKVFLNGANLLQEGSLETRSYAKAFFKTLSDHPNYNRFILEYIPTRIFRNIEKTLRSIK